MKILRITAQGLPLFKEDLDICFYTQQRVSEDDKDSLYKIGTNYYLHSACAFIGINASGKTSVLKVINLALSIVKNEPINHVEAKSILGGTEKATICTYFYDNRKYICCLETVIAAKKAKVGNYIYSILSERMWEKPISGVKSKKYLTDFTGMEPAKVRRADEEFLPDDVSLIISHNRKANDTVEVFSLLSYTNMNVLPFTEDIPLEVIAFLDPTIEMLRFEQLEGKTFIHLKFRAEDEIILNNAAELEQYLSSGTIKGNRSSGHKHQTRKEKHPTPPTNYTITSQEEKWNRGEWEMRKNRGKFHSTLFYCLVVSFIVDCTGSTKR